MATAASTCAWRGAHRAARHHRPGQAARAEDAIFFGHAAQLVPLSELGLQRMAEGLRHEAAAAAWRHLRLDVRVDLAKEPAQLAQPGMGLEVGV